MEDVTSFKKKINSYIKRCEEGNVCLLNFLDEAERSVVLEECKYNSSFSLYFNGGIINSLRNRCILSPYEVEDSDFKIKVYQIIYNKKFYEITHRSILGSLMSLGIKRETLGDIVIKDNKEAFFCCTEEISPFIESEFKSVGRASIQLKECSFPIENELKFEEKVHFLSSLRLDVCVCAAYSYSRQDVLNVLTLGDVYVNNIMNQNPSHIISKGDQISVRHKGKFIVSEIGGNSKSGRIIVTISKLV